jgi:hypothetical protein
MAPHDPLFKRLLRTFFADFLRIVAPDLAERLDLGATVFLDKEFPSPGPPEKSRIVDLLVRYRSGLTATKLSWSTWRSRRKLGRAWESGCGIINA